MIRLFEEPCVIEMFEIVDHVSRVHDAMDIVSEASVRFGEALALPTLQASFPYPFIPLHKPGRTAMSSHGVPGWCLR